MNKPLIYFLCTGNSCRSQIADGFMNTLGGHRYEVLSAGLEAHGLNPRAVQVMKEAGVDISRNSSNVIDANILNRADYVITLCGHADEHCPVISNEHVIKWHWGFDDPAKATGTEEEIMNQFRKVRDDIKRKIEQFLEPKDKKSYHTLHDNRIFMGAASDVEAMVNNEGIEVVVDLRGEATECAYPGAQVEWIQIQLGDNAEQPQAEGFKQAIRAVTEAYHNNKKVAFHCAGGRGRTGAVAAGVLIQLELASTLEEAEAMAVSIRDIIHIKPAQKEALNEIYPKGVK
jgi:arsenate reductase